jgi:uncharacterized protein (TIGR02453 family)
MSLFTKDTVNFFARLEKNNNKVWFEAHRNDLEQYVMEPARVFVMCMGDVLREIAPNVQAIPSIDKSIFRLHRDVRFSKNKAPYKTNLGIFLWEGPAKKMECSGFYTHIEPKNFFVGLGMYMFTPEQIKKFRDAVSDPANAEELTKIIRKLKTKGYKINEASFKKIPRGYDKEYKYADLLKYNGLYAFYESNDWDELLNSDQIKFLYKKFKEMLPIHKWLLKNMF